MVVEIETRLGYQTLFSPTAANFPTDFNAVQVNSSSFRVSWTPPATVTGYQVYWSGDGGSDSGNVSARARDTAVTITGRTAGLTYEVTIVALSDYLPSPVVGAVMVTLGEPHITGKIRLNRDLNIKGLLHQPKLLSAIFYADL